MAARTMEAARSQQAQAMEKMKQHLSPEQLKMMSAQMDAAMATGGGMQDVPDENLALMEKYRDRMTKLRSR